MKCEFDYCIYNQDFSCVLNEIEINSLGQCVECIVVSIPYDILVALKTKQLQDIIKRDEDMNLQKTHCPR